MSLTFEPEAVPLRWDNGVIRVGGTRLMLDILIDEFNQGTSPEVVAHEYDTVQLADVYAIYGYYLRHREAVDAYMRRREQEAEELRKKIEAAQPGQAALRERILARYEELKKQQHASVTP